MQKPSSIEQSISKLFDESFGRGLWRLELPATDMYEENGQLVVEASLPKFKEDEVEVTVSDSNLEIKAEHKEEAETKERKYYIRETSSGSFWRRMALPTDANATEATATFRNGVLKISMPLAESAEPKKIAISSTNQN